MSAAERLERIYGPYLVDAKGKDGGFGLAQYAFRTDSYRLEIVFNADGSWSYVSDTMLAVRGRAEPFRHRDVNTLVKVAEPQLNPLFVLQGAKT